VGPRQALDDGRARGAAQRGAQARARCADPRRWHLLDLAREALPIARGGLVARGRLSKAGDSEAGFLEPLEEIVASGKVPAQRLLDKFHGEWGGDIGRVYEESF
jgi:glutamate--cysteine ligase